MKSPLPESAATGGALALAGLSALLASGCCVAPLLLALAGISGAWISRLHVLTPYSDALLALAVALLGLAGWQLFRRVPTGADPGAGAACAGPACRSPVVRRWFWAVLALTLVPLVVPLMAPWFY